MSSTSSDDEIIGAEAEQEYEQTLHEAPAPAKSSSKRVRLTNSQRLQLIDGFRQGKTDKFYNVIPNKNKPGDYRIVKRRKPLDVPIADNNPEPINMAMHSIACPSVLGPNIEPEPHIPVPEPVREEKNEKKHNFGGASSASGAFHTEFYTMQNTINNSLSKEIAAVMEKCNKIEAKMKKQKARMKQQRLQRAPPVPDEYVQEYGDTTYRMTNQNDLSDYEEEPVNEEPEYRYDPSRFNVRRRIDLRNF